MSTASRRKGHSRGRYFIPCQLDDVPAPVLPLLPHDGVTLGRLPEGVPVPALFADEVLVGPERRQPLRGHVLAEGLVLGCLLV